ncbi:CRACD-like protein isoform X4 [Gallus gallus]|uniref:CRACD-like protein isoform X4 n=1 Tax=Gallus gallus TaxID=9031 RepID=UPI001AE6AA97|nr:CRACD-like protein isoform X4 [Gallus gallus]
MSSPRTMDPKVRETEGYGEDNSGKKKSKFKSFKKFFVKKKRKESSSGSSNLKLFQSTSDVAASHDMHASFDSEDEHEAHKGIMGSRALSHDSIFIPEIGQESARPVRVFSQENVSDRIRALQMKLQPTMKLGPPPPFGYHAKRTDDAGTSSEDDGLPRSPPEMSLFQEILSSGTTVRVTLGPHSRSRSTDGQLYPRHGSAKTKAPHDSDSSISPAANFETPPELSSCLDNSAAKHKLLIKPRNQRSSKMRRFSQRTQSESLTDLSCTPEEEEDDEKEMHADLPDAVFKTSDQEVPCGTSAVQDMASWQKPRMPEDLPPALRLAVTQPVSESAVAQEALLPENEPKGCQPMLDTCVKSECLLMSEGKGSTTSLHSAPDGEVQKPNDASAASVLLSGDVSSDVSTSTLNKGNKELPSVISAHKIPSEEDISTTKNSNICLEELEENIQSDDQVPVEMCCNKETKKVVAMSSESSKQFFIGSSQPTDSSHVLHPSSSAQVGSYASQSLEKAKAVAAEASASGKENSQSVVHKEEILGKKNEKAANELNASRKFSVSSARERPKTRSLHFPEGSVCENPLNTKFFLSNVNVSLKNEKLSEDLQKGSDLEDRRSSDKNQALLPESDSENMGQSTEMLAVCGSPAVDAVPVQSDSSAVSPNQQSCEDKNPFQVKLRSTSLSLKYRDHLSSESKGIKRYSAEFNLENQGLTLFLKGDKAEIKKTADTNIDGSLNEKIKSKAKSSEQLSSKPPLPKKPVLQNITVPSINACKEKQDKTIHAPESRNEDRDVEKRPNPTKVPERSVSLVIAGDSRREPDSPTEPAWITIARQKQWGTQQEQELDGEKPVTPDTKSDTEKQNKEKERTEGSVKQQWSKPSHLAPKTTSEEQRKESKPEAKEPLTRTNSLSHFVSAQPPAPGDKDEIGHLKKASSAAPDQPSWMELAKKKSQAWSDMPQIIK